MLDFGLDRGRNSACSVYCANKPATSIADIIFIKCLILIIIIENLHHCGFTSKGVEQTLSVLEWKSIRQWPFPRYEYSNSDVSTRVLDLIDQFVRMN